MKLSYSKLFFFLSLVFVFLFLNPVFAEEEITADQINSDMKIETHVQNKGWQAPVAAGATAGTEGQSLALEALKIDSSIGQFSIKAHVQNLGWQNPVTQNQEAGTTGKGLAIEALVITLNNAPNVDLYYRAHTANFGWLGWAKNGETIGTTGCNFPIEALQIIAVPKNSPVPGDGNTQHPSIDVSEIKVSLNTHVSNLGWLTPVAGGQSGTTGHGLAVQAIELKVEDPLGKSAAVGQAFISNIGWQNTKGPNEAIGTTGQNLPIEAFRFSLEGPAAKIFDINYRAHVSNLGWLGTTSGFNLAGTASGSIPVECVEVNLVRKGAGVAQNNAFKQIQTPLGVAPIGPNCIIINKSLQRMVFYQNYDVKVNTNVVTGMQWCDDSLNGNWKVEEKLPHYRTKGPGYDAVVTYWLTLYIGPIKGFNGEGQIVDRVGIHDADWRTNWAPNAYLTDGSHGCINTPFSPMKYIYENCYVGMPVMIR